MVEKQTAIKKKIRFGCVSKKPYIKINKVQTDKKIILTNNYRAQGVTVLKQKLNTNRSLLYDVRTLWNIR